MITTQLSDKQIEFIEFMEKAILPNRREVGYETLQHAGNLVGISINTSCRTCAAKSGTDLLNLYGRLHPSYLEYLESKKVVETPVVEQKKTVEDVVVEDEIQEYKEIVIQGKEMKNNTLPKKNIK
jgi:hypothetical protein